MKSNLLRVFFEWALIASLLMSVGFFAWFFSKSRAMRASQAQLGTAQIHFQNNRALLEMLQADCQQYAKTNADFARFLDSMAPRPPAAPAAPAISPKPGAK